MRNTIERAKEIPRDADIRFRLPSDENEARMLINDEIANSNEISEKNRIGKLNKANQLKNPESGPKNPKTGIIESPFRAPQTAKIGTIGIARYTNFDAPTLGKL